VKQNYQTIDAAVRALAVPVGVSVALGEIVADVREGLLAMAVGTGLGGDGRDDERRRDRGVRAER
jgi:hypothetical protein